jgi:peptidoglycan/LPS O-acetylase OafA/YrhL
VSDDYALKPLPFGPVAIAGACVIGGYVALVMYQAWRQGDAFRAPIRDFLAILIVIGFLSVVAYMFVSTPNAAADILVGALIAAFSAIVAMYFKVGGKDE